MIRIDEIYCNTFLPRVQAKPCHGMHWFDPFGSVQIEDMCNRPPVTGREATRYLFWDQEPLHRDLVDQTLKNFVSIYHGKLHIVTSEYQSENVEYVQDTYGMIPHYYFFHGWAVLDWYRGYNRSFLGVPYKDRKIQHTFLCPNNIIGGRRTHRIHLFNQLVQRNLLENNLVSFPEVCPHEKKFAVTLGAEQGFDFSNVDLPLRIDDVDNYHARSHAIDLWTQAGASLLQVVTETVYQGRRQHLTEKIFKPIVMQQPFVLVSCQGSLEYLRRYGFQTFGDFWDEDYDDLDDHARIVAVGSLLENLNKLSAKEKQHLHQAMQATVEHNYNWFYNGGFEQILWKELTDMLQDMNV